MLQETNLTHTLTPENGAELRVNGVPCFRGPEEPEFPAYLPMALPLTAAWTPRCVTSPRMPRLENAEPSTSRLFRTFSSLFLTW